MFVLATKAEIGYFFIRWFSQCTVIKGKVPILNLESVEEVAAECGVTSSPEESWYPGILE